ncbi:TRAP transporter substrate-binding protein [Glutamicibacter sp. PAEs-4]|uniref:TRAP transporter substrate-binding protein n=1 Tax=Glutamicibacter sp. PAEs-4 TaxID=3444114 RepID=UPI003EB7AC95
MKLRALRWVAGACAAVLALTGCTAGVSGNAQEGKTMVLSLNQSESHPSYIALTDFGERLKAATDGRWDIKVYPNETLGAQQEVIQLVSDGSVDMAIASGTQLENLNPEFATLNLPTVFKGIDHQISVLRDKGIVGPLFSSLEESKDLTVLGGLTQGDRNLYTVKGPINEPKDLAGMKIRVQESELHIKMINAMGGAATPMSYGEVYTALQAGVLDGAENNEISYVTQKHNEVAKFVARTRHLVGLDYMLVNSTLLEEMTPEDRAILETEWQKTVDEHVKLWNADTEKAIESAKASGTKFNDVDKAAFDKALAPVVESALTSDDARELYEKITETAQ